MQVTTTDSTAPSDQVGNNVNLGTEMVQGETAGMQFPDDDRRDEREVPAPFNGNQRPVELQLR